MGWVLARELSEEIIPTEDFCERIFGKQDYAIPSYPSSVSFMRNVCILLSNAFALLSADCKMCVCGTNTRTKRSLLNAFGGRNGLRSRPSFLVKKKVVRDYRTTQLSSWIPSKAFPLSYFSEKTRISRLSSIFESISMVRFSLPFTMRDTYC